MPVELTVWGHDPSDSQVYVDPSLIPGAREGDIAELWLPKSASFNEQTPTQATHSVQPVSKTKKSPSVSSIGTRKSTVRRERKNLYFLITKPKTTHTSSSKPSLPTVSVSSSVLNTLGIRPRSQVHVKILKSKEEQRKVYLDVVEIHFRGVNLTRNDHYKIAKEISGNCVNCGQRLGYLNNSVRLTIDTLYRNGKRKFSGFIDEDTRLVFRSDSARILIFIQMSSEMWNFDESGDIMFHRLVNSFIPEMLHRWYTQGDSHLVSIILFTSVSTRRSKAGTNHVLGAGVLEHETSHFYRVVVDSVHISRWSDIMRTLRSEFEQFPQQVLEDPETHELLGYFLPSSKSNILEAFSLATTLLTSKFVDRDLCRTGVQAMVATAGPACFDVDLSELWNLSRRLLGVEIGIELVCLARPPLHVTPLFRALLPATENDLLDPEEASGFHNWKHPSNTRLVFCVPTWINMSFWVSPDKYMKQWIPRCRIYDIQMAGLIENESRTLGLKSFQFDASELTHNYMRSFDASVFKSVDMIESQKRVENAVKTADTAELRPRNEGLDKGIPASAVTTVAVARPVISTMSPGPIEPPSPGGGSGSRFALNLTPTVSVDTSDRDSDSKSSGNAKSSLGALLGTRAGSLRKPSSLWSLSQTKSASSQQHNSHGADPKRDVSTESITPAASSVQQYSERQDPPIYTSTPARKVNRRGTRRESRLSRPHSQFSPTSSKFAGTSPRSPRKYFARRNSVMTINGLSPDHDRPGFGTSPSASAANGYGTGSMCDTSRPELQNSSMWRVLPNSAIIDNPSRVEAYGRWANVYPPNKKSNSVSWHSLKSPASLPLTSESFPDLVSFREHYKFQFYDVAVDNDEMSLSMILDEMIGLRLQLGFQIAVGSNVRAIEASFPRGNPNRVVAIVPREVKDCIGLRIYMTRMGLVHRLAIDDDHTVNVRLYTWIDRNARWLKNPLNEGRIENVKVKSRHDSEYKNINKKFLDQGIEHFNWSMIDQQVSGADDPLLYPSSANTQNLVTIRYVLLPAEAVVAQGHDTLTAEEAHVEGITRIVRLLLRNREAGSIDSDFIVHYYTGKLSKSIGEIVHDSNSALEVNRLDKLISLEDLAAEMKGVMGLKFRDRRWHWKQFEHVFTGHDLVVWLMKTFEDISTAEDAEAYGADVMRRGLIRHPENRHPFIDGHYFYELTPEYDYQEQPEKPHADSETNIGSDDANANAKENKGSSSTDPNAESGISTPSNTNISTNTTTTNQTGSKKNRAKVHVSDSCVINIDPRGLSGRPERVKVSIDRMHNPKNAFHILVEWLSVTPRLIDDLFSSAGRLASQYGLRLVQVPVSDVSGSLEDSPFRSAMRIKPDIELSDKQESRWFRHYMLRRSGYVLDVYDQQDISNDEYEVLFFWGRLHSSSPQYIHSSGFVLVQVEDDGNFCITSNTLHLSRAVLVGNSAAAHADTECESLMNDLSDLCRDREKLQLLLEEGREHRKQVKPASYVTVMKSRKNR